VAETAQRFVVHAESRRFARVVGYPIGLALLVAAFFIPDDRAGLRLFAAVVGPGFLIWSWSHDRRHVEVTEQKLTVVNTFSRHEVPCTELTDIEIDRERNFDNPRGPDEFYLALVIPGRRIRADIPYLDEYELTKVRARILRAREVSANEARPDAQAAATGQPERAISIDRSTRRGRRAAAGTTGRPHRTVGDWLQLALLVAVVFVIGLPAISILVLDALAAGWLIGHLPFWDELIGFYDWLGWS